MFPYTSNEVKRVVGSLTSIRIPIMKMRRLYDHFFHNRDPVTGKTTSGDIFFIPSRGIHGSQQLYLNGL